MYSLYLRERIVRLSQFLSGAKFLNALREEGFNVSRGEVYHVIKKWKKDNALSDYPRSGRPKVWSTVQHDRICQWLTENNELTINDMLLKLGVEGVYVS